jgi:hypothetical protein
VASPETTVVEPDTTSSGATADHPPSRAGAIDHIFLSYKSEDRHRARVVAEALERRGWPVWWDRDIQAGQAFRRVIANALEDAGCVVVLWSEGSVTSEWVLEEAQEAKARSILIPVLLDDVRQPLGFGQTQAASLVGWDGSSDDPMLGELLRGVATLLGFVEVPPLLNDEEWAAVSESARSVRSRAAAARATEERATAEAAREAAERAGVEREAAAHAGDADVEADAAKRQAEATAAAQAATRAAEEREAAMAAELAEEHAAELRAVAARKAAMHAEVEAAEETAHAAEARAEAARAARIVATGKIGVSEAAIAKASWFRFPREGVATFLGAALVAIAVFLPWIAEGDESEQAASELSLQVLFDYENAAGSGGSVGTLLLVVAIAGGVLALFRIPRFVTVLLGVVAVLVAMLFLVAVLRFLTGDERADQYFEVLRLGPAATLVGGLLMLSGR